MEILDRKHDRILWSDIDAEGRRRYEWLAHSGDIAREPHEVHYYSRRQADLAWKQENPRPPGRPRTASDRNRRADGNPALTVRMPEEMFRAVEDRGGPEWVRQIIASHLWGKK